jgi:hypothetical protein
MNDTAAEAFERIPDDVVNQRLFIGIYVTATGNREGSINAHVYADRSTDGDIPFEPVLEGARGWDGAGLSAEERRYVSAALLTTAARFASYEEPTDAQD